MSPADIAFETTPDRCRRCSKRLMIDVGGGIFGEIVGVHFCPHCGNQPEAADWATGLRTAIRAVLNQSRPTEAP